MCLFGITKADRIFHIYEKCVCKIFRFFISIWNICVQSKYLLKNNYEQGLFDFWSVSAVQTNIEQFNTYKMILNHGQV